MGQRRGGAAAVMALAWVLRRPEVTGAIVGARRPTQVDGFAPALELRLTAEEVAEVDRFLAANP
jgi:aryl-alcohol dehydrogenase-like predicted oxidoreductase